MRKDFEKMGTNIYAGRGIRRIHARRKQSIM